MAGSLERDLECGANFERLLELGCFDREFIFYGYGYCENGNIHYRVSSRADSIDQALHNALAEQVYPTPVATKIIRTVVASGQNEIIKQQAKWELACMLKTYYNKAYFQAIWQLAKEPPSNLAYPLIQALQEENEGRFCDEGLQILEGFYREAFANKTLSYSSFMEFEQWIQNVRSQMDDDIMIKDRFKRVFSGFAYQKPSGQLIYYYDAQPHTVNEKHALYQQQGILVTPIYRKTYWFHDTTEISKLRYRFAEELAKVIDQKVIQYAQTLRQLPSVYEPELYYHWKDYVKTHCTEQAYQAFIGYGNRWLIK